MPRRGTSRIIITFGARCWNRSSPDGRKLRSLRRAILSCNIRSCIIRFDSRAVLLPLACSFSSPTGLVPRSAPSPAASFPRKGFSRNSPSNPVQAENAASFVTVSPASAGQCQPLEISHYDSRKHCEISGATVAFVPTRRAMRGPRMGSKGGLTLPRRATLQS